MVSDQLVAALKKQARRQMLYRLQRISDFDINAQSRAITRIISASNDWISAPNIALFYSMQHEVQTKYLLQLAFHSGKRVYLPRAYGLDRMHMLEVYSLEDIETFPLNPWGIREPPAGDSRHDPMKLGDLDIVYMPGLAFDQNRNRLGYGKGYYDKWLDEWRSHSHPMPKIIGLCLKEQVLETVPVDDHDVVCDYVSYADL